MQLNTFFTSSLAMAVTVVFANTPSITVFTDDQCHDLPGITVPCAFGDDYISDPGQCVPFDATSLGGPVVQVSLKQ